MAAENKNFSELYHGLQELSVGAFPKTCATCGKVYNTLREFLEQTQLVSGKSGLKSSIDDDDRPIVELFRNCVCGSTMMDICHSRRDESETGKQRREKFGRMLELLMQRGIEREMGRLELLKMMRGEQSELINAVLQRGK